MISKREQCKNWTLYAITCPERLNGRSLESVAEEAVRGGADVVQLRDKTASDTDLLDQARRLLKVTRHYRVPLIINDRLTVAKYAGAEGLHLGQEDGAFRNARQILGHDAILGRSTHSPEQARKAQEEGFDYIGVGPLHATPTKPGRSAVGLELVRFASRELSVPFVAIGGIDASNVDEVVQAGGRCVAVVRALMGCERVFDAAQHFKQKMGVSHAY